MVSWMADEPDAEQSGADARKQRAEPEAMVEQPEGLVRLATAEMARQSERKDQARRRSSAALSQMAVSSQSSKAKHRDAEQPQQSARLRRSPLALREEIDRDDPNERRGEPGHDPELGVADHAAVITACRRSAPRLWRRRAESAPTAALMSGSRRCHQDLIERSSIVAFSRYPRQRAMRQSRVSGLIPAISRSGSRSAFSNEAR